MGFADLTASTTVLPEGPPTIFTLTALATESTLEALTPVLTLIPEEP